MPLTHRERTAKNLALTGYAETAENRARYHERAAADALIQNNPQSVRYHEREASIETETAKIYRQQILNLY